MAETDAPGYPDMPVARTRHVNGVRLAVFEAGPEDGPAIVLAHGFPEIAYSWHAQIPSLAAAGYHVMAPDQRGYGWSDAPNRVEAYDMAALTGDLVGLLDAAGHDRGIFVGHDWGGLVVWQLPLMHPDRVAGIIGVNTPFIPRLRSDPIVRMREALGEGMYIVYFQRPDEPEALLGADLDRTFRFFMRVPKDPGGATMPLRADNASDFRAAFRAPEETWPGVPLLSAAERAVYVRAYERSGFFGPVSWYRNFSRNWHLAEGLPQHGGVPALMITAECDAALPPSMAEGIERYVPDVEVHCLEGCGHWTQKERPEALNALMLDWLSRRFPAVAGR
ncbi:MAG: alpha/beta fold hydrolase [Alphaproteobacteria bacterium]